MIVNCECGKKKFNIDSSLIPKEGRLLKCGSCSKIWHYTSIIETKNKLFHLFWNKCFIHLSDLILICITKLI